MIIVGADNRPPMLKKSLYDSWKSRMEIYIDNQENGRMILNSVQNGLLVWPTIVEKDDTTRTKGVKLLMQLTKLSLQERECRLYDEFDKFLFVKGETLYQYYWRFAQLINNMNAIRDDPIVCLNNAMTFLIDVASSRFSSTNNQIRTSSNLRNQGTIQDGRVTVQQIQGRQGQSYVGTIYKGNATSYGGNNVEGQTQAVKCYNCQGEGYMARQCTQPKRPKNTAWFKKKAMLAEAQESGQILDEEQLAFLADPGIPNGQAAQTTIPNTVAFQTKDLDAYDSNCDDVSNAKAVLMANLSNYSFKVISKKLVDLKCLQNKTIQCKQEKKFNTTPITYVELNRLSDDFGKRLVPQQELCDEQAFWLQTSHPNTDQSASSPVKIKAPQELPKVSLVNTSLKKLKYHLGEFDTMLKKRSTLDAIT
nr:hypothetical protein [Tanacetum cinerariifolium]